MLSILRHVQRCGHGRVLVSLWLGFCPILTSTGNLGPCGNLDTLAWDMELGHGFTSGSGAGFGHASGSFFFGIYMWNLRYKTQESASWEQGNQNHLGLMYS